MIELNKYYFRYVSNNDGVDYATPILLEGNLVKFTIKYFDGGESEMYWLQSTSLIEWIPCTELLGALR